MRLSQILRLLACSVIDALSEGRYGRIVISFGSTTITSEVAMLDLRLRVLQQSFPVVVAWGLTSDEKPAFFVGDKESCCES